MLILDICLVYVYICYNNVYKIINNVVKLMWLLFGLGNT